MLTRPSEVILEPIAVIFQLMRPTWPGGRLLGDDWLARMNESGRRIQWPAARITHTLQHAADIGSDPKERRAAGGTTALGYGCQPLLWGTGTEPTAPI